MSTAGCLPSVRLQLRELATRLPSQSCRSKASRRWASQPCPDDSRNWFRIVLGIWKNPSTTGVSTHTVLYTNSFPEPADRLPDSAYSDPQALRQDLHSHFSWEGQHWLPASPAFRDLTHHFRKPIVVTFDALSSIPDKQWFLSMVSDSSASPSPGFVSGDLKFTWIDI